MVRKRGSSKRSTSGRRIKKYRYKADPRTTTLAFKQRLDPMALDLDYWLIILDELEKRVKELCIAQGIPTEELDNYFAYAKTQFKVLDRFTALTAWQELQIKVAEFVLRGLRETKVREIIPVLEDLLEGKKIFFKTGQAQLIDDYLRFKMMAVVRIPKRFEQYIKPKATAELITAIRPLLTRVFELKPILEVYFSYSLVIQYLRIFRLRPFILGSFDYRVSTYSYFETELRPIVPPAIIFSYSISVRPFRTFRLTPKISIDIRTYPKPTIREITSLQPMPTLEFKTIPSPAITNKTELRPTPSLEFSYEISPA